MTKKGTVAVLVIAAFAVLALAGISGASVQWQELMTLETAEKPIDMAVSADGKLTFVLTDKGNVLVYSAEGKLKEKISIGKSVDGIDVSSSGDRLFLSSGKDRTVRVVSLEFVQDIDVSRSPFKGPEGAPVVVAVFSDFQ